MGLGLAVESVFVLTVVIFVASHLHQGNGHVQNRSFHRLFGRWSISYAHLWHDIVDGVSFISFFFLKKFLSMIQFLAAN